VPVRAKRSSARARAAMVGDEVESNGVVRWRE